MYCPNYLEFYQKAVIAIGPKDRKSLLDNNCTVNSDSSHWMIALDGRPMQNKPHFYKWNIVIYQADAEGFFLLKQPYYVSRSYVSFDEAYGEATKIEEVCRFDHFVPATPEKQII